MRRKNGFTLIELLAVVSILAILVIIAMPSIIDAYNKSRRESFIAEARNVLNATRQAYATQSMRDNWIEDVGSQDEYRCIGYSSSECDDKREEKIYYTMDMDGNSNIDYYIQLDGDGEPYRYVITNGVYSVFSESKREEITSSEIIDYGINMEAYINEFNVQGPTILKRDAYSREKLQFDFNAKTLKESALSGATHTTWTSDDGRVSGTLYSVNKSTGVLNETLGTFDGNSIVFPGWQGFRFDASFDFDNTGGADGYGSFTLEATVNLSDFKTVKNHPYVNLISNIESGGYYLNVYHVYTDNGVYGWPGLSVHLNGTYKHCTSTTPIKLGEDYVIAGSFNRDGNITKVYINGEQVPVGVNDKGEYVFVCDYNDSWNLKYPPEKDGRKVPLSVGGNPSYGSINNNGKIYNGFTNVEWIYGKVYTARIYKGILDSDTLKSNYYSNMVLVNDYDEDSQIITLQECSVSNQDISYCEYSFDRGETWSRYDENDKPILYQNGWVYARVITKNGVVSPASKAHIYLN